MPELIVNTYVDAALGQEGNASLWVSRLVLRQVFELVVFVLVVSDVAVAAETKSVRF